jgi:hypothetical protein
MDVINFLCVLLVSSRVQLHNSLGSRRACACTEAGFSSQNFEECTTEERRFVVRVFMDKRTQCKDIHKEMFPVYGGKCLSRNSFKDFRKSQIMPYQGLKWLRQQSKDFYAVGFDALVKRWGKCINVCGGYVDK